MKWPVPPRSAVLPLQHTIDVLDLQRDLPRHLAEVARGASLVVTDRGREVARLEPPARVPAFRWPEAEPATPGPAPLLIESGEEPREVV